MRLAEVGDDEEHRRAADGDWHLGVQRREEVMLVGEMGGTEPTSRFVAGLHAGTKMVSQTVSRKHGMWLFSS